MSQKLHIGGQAHDTGLGQSCIKIGQCLFSCLTMHDEFGHHRVVERTDAVAFTHTIVNANCTSFGVMRCHLKAGAHGLAIYLQHTSRWQEIIVWVLSAYPRFNSMAMHAQLVLLQR